MSPDVIEFLTRIAILLVTVSLGLCSGLFIGIQIIKFKNRSDRNE